MINSPIKLPSTLFSSRIAPSPDLQEERDKGGSDNSSQQAVYLADLNVCYYQQCLTKTVCQQEDNESKLLLRQNLKQRQKGLYELQILIQIDHRLIELNHYFGKNLDISKQITPLSQITCNTKKVQRIRPSCVQNAIQSIGIPSITISPTLINEKQTLLEQYDDPIFNCNSNTLQKQSSLEGICQKNIKANQFQSHEKEFLLCQQDEDIIQNQIQFSQKQQSSLSEIQKSTCLISTSIGTEQEINIQNDQQIESRSLILHLNSQFDQNKFQHENFQLKLSSDEQNKNQLDVLEQNLPFSPSVQQNPIFDLSLIKECNQQNSSSKKNNSNNLVKNILVGFKTSLTNPRSKIFQDIHYDIKSLKGDKYSDFKKKLKQFFKKPRTNLSDIISIFSSQQKKDVFKLFIEKYSNNWIESSPIQDKDSIRKFLDFLLLCYQQPNKIQVLNPYRRNKQRHLYRITESDEESQEIQLHQEQSYFHQIEESQNEQTNSQNQNINSHKESVKGFDCDLEQLQTNKSQIQKNRNVNKDKDTIKKNYQKLQYETNTIEEEISIHQNEKNKQKMLNFKKLDHYNEETSEIQSCHQLSPNNLQKRKMQQTSQCIIIQFQYTNFFYFYQKLFHIIQGYFQIQSKKKYLIQNFQY